MITRLRELYEGQDLTARRFRSVLIAADFVIILFVIAASFVQEAWWIGPLNGVFGVYVAADLAARLATAPRLARELSHIGTWADIVVALSFIAPLFGAHFEFLRVIRALRLLRSYHMLRQLRAASPWFRRRQEVILASVNLFVFLFVTTAIVYETQHGINPGITNYADALYFTVTTLTTTGFGDITMKDTGGRLLSVIIMIVGISLFLRLVQLLFRPSRVPWRCPGCGLDRHEEDAIHCRHCGEMLHMPHHGHAG